MEMRFSRTDFHPHNVEKISHNIFDLYDFPLSNNQLSVSLQHAHFELHLDQVEYESAKLKYEQLRKLENDFKQSVYRTTIFEKNYSVHLTDEKFSKVLNIYKKMHGNELFKEELSRLTILRFHVFSI